MGHALNNSIQDLLVRYYRMNNYETYGNQEQIMLVLPPKPC